MSSFNVPQYFQLLRQQSITTILIELCPQLTSVNISSYCVNKNVVCDINMV